MRLLIRFVGILLAILLVSVGLLASLYPEESYKRYQKIKKSIMQYMYPKKPTNSYQTFKVKLPKDYGLHGIDVSRYQGEIDWEKVRHMKVKDDSVTFVFIKATEGITYFDKYFYQNWQESKRVGILRGAYHYFRPELGGEEQARYFMSYVYLDKGDLPPVLDIEEIKEIAPEKLRKELKIFLDILEERYQVCPILYTNKIFYESYLGNTFKKYPLWIAQYKNLKPPRIKNNRWLFWQHSYEGTVSGINVPVDLNVFVGDIEDLKDLCKK